MQDIDLSGKINAVLLEEEFQVDIVKEANQVQILNLKNYDLMIIDAFIGDSSGFKIAKSIKENSEYSKLPIVFVTSKSTENERLTGFAVGAEDYIVYPFSFKELTARIKAVLKRFSNKNEISNQIIKYNELELNLLKFKVALDNHEVSLTKREFELLKLFLSNINKVFSREEILDMIWYDDELIQKRTIDVNINRLRNKIGRYGSKITTIAGYGYCFEQ
jgi:DNA-binding response OmpR family regulator